jgi:pyruvate/2-oxoglutarate dehydrogenase complex dihydrolipoamide acyltransferase (E2) component
LDKINLGIAMDNGSNLKVLLINSADEKSLEEIQDSITNLLELYDSGKTIPSEFFESSIIVTDLSGQGIEFTVPTLSSGQAIILSLGRDIESNYYISCTYDHRVMEGFYVSNFLNSLRDEINRLLEWTCERSPSIACHACEKTIEEELGLDSSNRGLIIMKTANDNEILLCHNCFEGF